MRQRQTAILVDAGYFFAQASETLFGAPKPRSELDLDNRKALDMLRAKAQEAFPGREILRVYWYDAPPTRQGGMSSSQEELALMPGLKMRLGSLNGAGQQKGVDALICRDMEELAEKGAVDSVLLVSGDEDLRLAVEKVQSFGVRVGLLGVGPGNASIGMMLLMEADGRERLGREEIAQILAAKAGRPNEFHGQGSRPASKSARKRAKGKPEAKPSFSAPVTPPSGATVQRVEAKPTEPALATVGASSPSLPSVPSVVAAGVDRAAGAPTYERDGSARHGSEQPRDATGRPGRNRRGARGKKRDMERQLAARVPEGHVQQAPVSSTPPPVESFASGPSALAHPATKPHGSGPRTERIEQRSSPVSKPTGSDKPRVSSAVVSTDVPEAKKPTKPRTPRKISPAKPPADASIAKVVKASPVKANGEKPVRKPRKVKES